MIYLVASLAFFPVSYVLIRLLAVAALWLFRDLIGPPPPRQRGPGQQAPVADDARPTLPARIETVADARLG
jgi:hypothetical protein